MILLSLVCVRLEEQKADRGKLYGIHNYIAFCTATNDNEGLGERFGNRAVGIAEKPYSDPNSRYRTEVLGERREKAESESN